MPTNSDTLALVLTLGQACEDLARAALTIAQVQKKANSITQDEFDQAFQDYSVSMQKARDMYYQASHSLAQQVATSVDLKSLTDQTLSLKDALARLQQTEKVLTISFGVVTAIGAVATAVLAPNATTLAAAASSIGAVASGVGG